MRRKSVRQVLQSIGRLRVTVETEGTRIARGLARRLAAPPAAAELYPLVLGHLEAELLALLTDLAAAEDAYAAAKAQPPKLRARRDVAFAQLYEMHGPLRRLLATFPVIECAGISSQTPRDPRTLVSEAGETVDLLHRLEQNPPPPNRGISMDPGALAAEVEAARQRLESVLDELEIAEARALAARQETEATMARTEMVAPWVMRALEGLAGLGRVGSVGVRSPG